MVQQSATTIRDKIDAPGRVVKRTPENRPNRRPSGWLGQRKFRMADEVKEKSAPADAPGVITKIDFDGAPFSDVYISPQNFLKSRTNLLGTALFFASAAAAHILDIWTHSLRATIACLACGLVALLILAVWEWCRVHDAVHASDELARRSGIENAILATCNRIGCGFASKIPRILKVIRKAGLCGQTVRIVSRRTFPILSPLSVTFEPCDLKELNEQFQLLASSLPGTEIADSNLASASTGHKVKTAKFKRKNLRSAILWQWPTTILFSASFMHSIINGRPNWLMGLAVIISLLGILLNSSTTPPLASSNWSILPGALLYRRPAGFFFGPRQHLFRRTDSLLFLWYFGFGVWAFWVEDDCCKRQMMIQPAEAQMLLRAWLSPVPPPTDEQLAQLLPS